MGLSPLKCLWLILHRTKIVLVISTAAIITIYLVDDAPTRTDLPVRPAEGRRGGAPPGKGR